MDQLPFARRVPLLNMSLTFREDSCAARWLSRDEQDYAPGQAVASLHQHIAERWQSEWVASFMGGRAALYAVIRALALQPGDEVLIPAFTCQCVTNAITFNGVIARFVDIEQETLGMNAERMLAAIGPRTRAVLIQYTFGLVCRDLEQLLDVARHRQLWIIEDCAHATGASWQGHLLGTLGDIAFFSSERSKIVNTIHGGWIVTRHPALGKRLMQIQDDAPCPAPEFITRLLHTLRHAYASLHSGSLPTPDVPLLPQMQADELNGLFSPQYQWRMAEPVAELLSLQLARLPEILARRQRGARYWQKWAQKMGLQGPKPRTDAQNGWLRYPLLANEPQALAKSTLETRLNVEAGVWFTTPMHPHPCELPDCPTGMDATRRCVNLPTWLWEAAD
ncbi:aminotransferase class I/II-fold pyridoxal phosphate-dependent enzyme [Jejubacter calystegiae]|uniref:Aminotransferase class I/II-fold pyridoxal phosphate-dependent enzyme n=1 Tax=Jejubacter calystegiae TaxID=2579935 RepID=A0A4P8YKI1_9ENTR|nr:aminotransferase class I/II-fold pyridoxal phosphate-dependent enzyme [Jejubacter calystegiae]QCT20184.1 aminotransferase class I/II-fold pyridoxal phosphate-dependent enzyme [Jejubacter calystegiae]